MFDSRRAGAGFGLVDGVGPAHIGEADDEQALPFDVAVAGPEEIIAERAFEAVFGGDDGEFADAERDGELLGFAGEDLLSPLRIQPVSAAWRRRTESP